MLRQNGREKYSEISKQTKMPISTVFSKHKQMEHLIKKYTSFLKFSEIGYYMRSFIYLKSKNKMLSSELLKSSHINSIYQINNGFHYLVDAYFKDIGQFEEFKEVLQKNCISWKEVPILDSDEELLLCRNINMVT